MNEECAAVSEALADLALGVLAGEERTAAVAHLEGCPRCSRWVAELSAASNELLHLAPAAEPPIGFEARVFERLGLKQPVPPARGLVGRHGRLVGRGRLSGRGRLAGRARLAGRGRLAGAVGGIAAAVALAFGGGLLAGGGLSGGGLSAGGLAGQAPRSSPAAAPASTGALETAALFSQGRPVGKVLVYPGNPTWVFMYMDDGTWTGALRCQVVEDRGPAVTLGTFWLSSGKGAWAASLSQPSGRLRSAQVVDASGHVLAVARLS